MHKTTSWLLLAVSIVAMTLLVLCSTASANAITINSIAVSGNQLTIGGVGFNGTLTVTLGGQKLNISSSTPTQIVATVDPIPAPGSYRLVVKAGGASTSAYVAMPSSPAVVATVALFNQTANVPMTTVFTPTTDGLYRFTGYAGEIVAGNTGGTWALELDYNTLQGTGAFNLIVGCNNIYQVFNTQTARILTGQPVAYTVTGDNGSGTYEMLITVERLM
jgi:hypothetical protein